MNGADMRFQRMIGLMGAIAAAMLGVTAPLTAVHAAPLSLNTQMFVEHVTTDINGRARRVLRAADRLSPGDTLVVVVNWRNRAERALSGIAVTNAIPGRLRIDPADPAMLVSVDGGANWGRLDQLWLPTPLGGTRRATAEDVTHIRWTMPGTIAPGQGGRIAYRATVR
jgi:hypothetical protein